MTIDEENVIPFGALLVMVMVLTACGLEDTPDVTTNPLNEGSVSTTEPTSPTTEPTMEPVTEPTTEPSTDSTEEAQIYPVGDPRQEGQRLTLAELEQFNELFELGGDGFSVGIKNYYNYALSSLFVNPQEYPLTDFFNGGFSNEWPDPITQDELDFFNGASGYGVEAGSIQRLPADLVEWYVEYYFGLPIDQMNTKGMYYYTNTDCYYIFCSDTQAYVFGGFHDGYYDQVTGMVTLYYEHYSFPMEKVITIQSKINANGEGYYIISNLPVETD